MITVEDWHKRGQEIVVPEGRVFVVDIPSRKSTESTPLLILHGFPTSSWDFADAGEALAAHRRVVLFDFLGFGFSDKPADASYSLFEQADVVIAVARKAGLSKVHLWAHDMGTSVATELLARRERDLLPFVVQSLVLMNGSMHIQMANLTPGQRLLRSPIGASFARIAGQRIFTAQMKRIFGRPVADATIDGMWSLLDRADGRLRLPKIIQYIDERFRFERRWIGALERIDLPVLIAWGERDPVARFEIAERLARDTPGAELVRWPELGHYPQVEDTARVVDALETFLSKRTP